MADDNERLIVELEARVTQFEKSFERANRTASSNWRQIEQRGREASRRIESDLSRSASAVAGSMRSMGTALTASLAGAFSARAIGAAAQQYVNLQNALKVAGVEGNSLNQTFTALFNIAQKNGTPIEALVTLYSRASQAQKELKASSADLLKFTDGVALALRVAGTSSEEASGALLQLGQALGSGKVQAEEFNSLGEQIRPMLQAVAVGLKEAGGSVATLKTLVNDGKVSSEAFFRAFIAGMPKLEADAAKATGTVSQGMTKLSNAFVLVVGELDKITGASTNAATNLSKVSTAIEGMPGYIQSAAGGFRELQSWLNSLGNHPIWTRINKRLGIEAPTPAPQVEFGPPKPPTSTPASTAPAATVTPVSLASYPIAGKPKASGQTEEQRRKQEVDAYIGQLERSGRILQAEFNSLGRSNAERVKAIELARIGTVVDAGQAAKIDANVNANEQLRLKIEQVRRAEEGLRDAARFAGEAITDGLSDVLIDGGRAEDAIANLARALARAALQSALLGSGPLAGLFGTAPAASGSVGGIFGALLGGHAEGGMIRGPGGPKSDSILSRLSDGEFVINAAATSKYLPLLEMINAGKVPRFADGGLVSPVSAPGKSMPLIEAARGAGAAIHQTMNMTVQGSAGTPAQNQDLADKMMKGMKEMAQGMMAAELRRQMRPGGMLR